MISDRYNAKSFVALLFTSFSKYAPQYGFDKVTQLSKQTQQPVNQWKEQVRGYKLWRVVKVALAFPVLGRSLNRDLSPLKLILVSGNWDRAASRLVPVSWNRGYGVDKYRQLGQCPHLNEAANKYPSQNCTHVQFC